MNRVVKNIGIFLCVGVLSSCSLFQGSGETCPAYSSNEEEETEQEKEVVLDTEVAETPKS